jgi:hypothetical protein
MYSDQVYFATFMIWLLEQTKIGGILDIKKVFTFSQRFLCLLDDI